MVRVLLPLAVSGPLCPGLEAVLPLPTKEWRIGGTCHQQTVGFVHTQAPKQTRPHKRTLRHRSLASGVQDRRGRVLLLPGSPLPAPQASREAEIQDDSGLRGCGTRSTEK